MKKIFAIAGFTLLFFNYSYSQIIDAEPESQVVCGGTAAPLTATLTPPGSGSAPGSLPTTSYAVSSIPYTPNSYVTGTVVPSSDDTQHGPFPIGFNFCFFGTNYTQFYIGSNGWVAFGPQPTTFTSAPIPNVGAGIPKNCIMGPWQDWLPGAANIRYQTLGVAPFRRLVVSWNNCPMFSCTSNLGTFQIVIYESTNVIENYIANKPACLAWAGGTAVQGLHNAAGTVAFTVPGRNSTAWTAVNEGWRYVPNGTAQYIVNWYILPANTLIASDTFNIPPDVAPFVSSINVFPPTSPQYYYAEVTGPNGCGPGTPNTDTVVVLSSSLFVDAGPFTPICEGSSTTLGAFAPGALSFTWSPGTGLSSTTISNPVANPIVSTTYTVMAVDGIGCTGFDTVTIAVNPAPFVDAGFGAGICSGDNIQLGGSGSGTYMWSPAATVSDPTLADPIVNPTVTTTYSLTVTDGIGCTNSDTVSIFIINPTANAGNDTTICSGSSFTLNATGGTSYTWSPATGLSSTSIPNPVASPTITTTYTLNVFDSGTGCSATDMITITVSPLPVADAGPYTNICSGTNTTLGASGGVSYSWTPTSGLSSATIFNPVASPTTTTTYTVIVTAASGCVSSDTVTVNVNPLPVVDAGSDVSICVGASTTLGASGASTYLWTPAGSLSNPSIANPVASPSSVTTYTVTGTDVNGCTDTDTVRIDLNGITITASPNTAVCNGSSTTLSASGAATYAWTPTGSLTGATTSSPVATPTTTTTYTVIGTASTGCKDTAFVTVTVNPLPVVNAGTALVICSGSSANLSVTGASSYLWSPAGSLSNPNIATPIASPTTTTLYTVTGTDLNGCSASDTISVIVHPLPTVSAGFNTTICSGTSTTLNGSGTTGTYSWSPGTGLSSTTVLTPVATPTATTTYTLTISAAGCSNTAQVTVTVNPAPVANAGTDATICSGVSTPLSASGGTSYSWSPATGLSNPLIANPTASPTTTTNYTVTVSNGACFDTDVVTVTVSSTMTIGAATITPATCGEIDGTITVGAVSGGTAPFMYSLNGGTPQSGDMFSGLAAGSYTITVSTAGGCTATQVVNVGTVNLVNASFTADPASGSGPLTVNFTNTSTGASDYIWSFGDSTGSILTNPSNVYIGNGQYLVTLIAYNGSLLCTDTATFIINVFDETVVNIPNVFSPNGDNSNETFRLVNDNIGVKEVQGSIFNRWGKQVAEWSGDATKGWDGKINGNEAEEGTYFYILTVTGMDNVETIYKGNVQLIR
ncbi:MAG: gliding motility-associated C-terminal domain-containing protein [Bacteroidota bacterium]|nr:gliding motility-associated C-terminal domain-containing protein [Bacteroidota bacterium]